MSTNVFKHRILLKDNNISLHMMACTYFCLYGMKIAMHVF